MICLRPVLVVLVLGVVCCGCGSAGPVANPPSVSSHPTSVPSPTRPKLVARVRRAALRACLARQAHVSEQLDRILAVFPGNYLKAWVYTSPYRARRVYRQARSYGIVPASLLGTAGSVFFQWKHHPSGAELKLFGRCLRLAAVAARSVRA